MSTSISAPSPFDAMNGPTEDNHPLRTVRVEGLVDPSSGAVSGQIVLDGPARVGDRITGRIHFTARREVHARSANLRLVGLRLDERTRKDGVWIEGSLFYEESFPGLSIPTSLQPGATWEAPFQIPTPLHGPPAVNLGQSIIAWAVEVRWDIAGASDHWLATDLPLAQNPDLVRAGIGEDGLLGLMASVPVGDATINVKSILPAPVGQEVDVLASWPSAPSGQGARIEIQQSANLADRVGRLTVASAIVDPKLLASGAAEARLLIPAGSAPTFEGAGIECVYFVHVLIDRHLRSDVSIERPIAVI
jgi:hypothetical protein